MHSQQTTSKTEKNTNINSSFEHSRDSFDTNSLLEAINSIHNNSVAEQESRTVETDCVVRKLMCLNNIFKELRGLKEEELPRGVERQVSKVEDRLIGLEREILKSSHF